MEHKVKLSQCRECSHCRTSHFGMHLTCMVIGDIIDDDNYDCPLLVPNCSYCQKREECDHISGVDNEVCSEYTVDEVE